METAPRTDAIRPSAIDPADFQFIGVIELYDPEDDRPTIFPGDGELLESVSSNPDRPREDVGICDHCGARLRFAAIHRQISTNRYVVFGQTCADETLGVDGRRALEAKRAKDAAAARRKNQREEAERQANLAETKRLYPEAVQILDGYDGHNDFLLDIASKFARFGNLSEKQANAVVRAAERDAAIEAEKLAAEPVPEGKQLVTGEVVKSYLKEDIYDGFKQVWIVKDDRGFKVWGTVPKAIRTHNDFDDENFGLKGKRVSFEATLVQSSKDPKFGFSKRPSKAQIH